MRQIAPVFIAIVLAACSGDHVTTPRPIAKLPPTPISSTLIQATSPAVAGTPVDDSTWVFDLQTDSLALALDDIRIKIAIVQCQQPNHAGLRNHYEDRWQNLEAAFPVQMIRYFGNGCAGMSNRLVSQMTDHISQQFLDAAGRFLLNAPGNVLPEIQALSYTDDYHFATIRVENFNEQAAIGIVDNSIYISQKYRPQLDSITALDLQGNRRWSVGHEFGHLYYPVFDGSSFWAHDIVSFRFLHLDTLGNLLESIKAPFMPEELVWADRSLWFKGLTSGPMLVEVDVTLSVASDSIITGRRVELPLGREICADSAGFVIATTGHIARFAWNGTFRDSFKHNLSRITAMAWDGESLWVLHHGPQAAYTDATLLSRFTLE